MSPAASESDTTYRAPDARARTRGPLSEDAPIAAEFGIRAAARIIDLIVVLLAAMLGAALAGFGLAVAAAQGWLADDWEARILQASESMAFVMLAAMIVYHAVSESAGGATLGKLACGLRVWSEDRTPCTWFGGMVRSLAFLIDGLFFGVIGYLTMSGSPQRQRVGDRWGKTIVVLARSTDPNARPPSAGVGIFAGLSAAVATVIAAFVVQLIVPA